MKSENPKELLKLIKELQNAAHNATDLANPFKQVIFKKGVRRWQVLNNAPTEPMTKIKKGKKITSFDVTEATGFKEPITPEKKIASQKASDTRITNKRINEKEKASSHIEESATKGYGVGKRKGKRRGRIEGVLGTTATLYALDRMRGNK